MDLQLFGEGATGWDGASPLLPAPLDSGCLHISRLPKAFPQAGLLLIMGMC